MIASRLPALLIVLAWLVLTCSRVEAFFHLWDFSEFFSNADGTVQFIELHTTGLSETVANGATITSTSTGKVYTLQGNLTGPTTNKRLLIATAGFGSLPGGVSPDFSANPLPPNFFNPAGDTVTLFQSFTIDTKTFASIPTDGIMSQNYSPVVGSAVNSPTNYAGASGSIDVSAPSPTGDYNQNGTVDAADYIVWRNTSGQAASPAGSGADGDSSGTIDVGDYTFWRAHFGNAVGTGATNSPAAVPEPTAVIMLVFAAPMGVFIRPRRSLN